MKARNPKIDIFKGILAIGMVFAHAVQLLLNGKYPVLNAISTLTNLVSFSGFLGAFGFAYWISYLSKEKLPWRRVAIVAIKCYLAFLLSGIVYRHFVLGVSVDFGSIYEIAAIQNVPGYSEFLVSFALFSLIPAVLALQLRFIVSDGRYVIICIFFVLIINYYLPKSIAYNPLVGVFFGGAGFIYFPVLQYSPIFLLGVWLARSKHEFNKIVLIISLLWFSLFLLLSILNYPISRSPPDNIWLVCSAFVAYIYYSISIGIFNKIPRWLENYISFVGRSVLLHLLISNTAFFLFCAMGFRNGLTGTGTIVVYMVVMASIHLLYSVRAGLQRTRWGNK